MKDNTPVEETKINLEEILNKELLLETLAGGQRSLILTAMKEACKQALELAAENAFTHEYFDESEDEWLSNVDKQSIIETIKQIE